MIVTIHQPSYWPWLGELNKIAQSDRFILLDNVDANKKAFQYRNIFLCYGKAKYLSLPVTYRMGVLLNELEFKNNSWPEDHLNKLENYYREAPYFNKIFPALEKLYTKGYKKPVDFIFQTMLFSMEFLNIDTEVLKGSDLKGVGEKGSLVLDLVKKANGKVYLSGKGALRYMTARDMDEFKKEDIKIEWQFFKHPRYQQLKKYPFVEGLACLDLFLFHGEKISGQIFWDNIHENLKKDFLGNQ
jgi:hypothetical protein